MAKIRADRDGLVVYGANQGMINLFLVVWSLLGIGILAASALVFNALSARRLQAPGVVVETPFGVFLARLTRNQAEASKLEHRLEEARSLT